MQPCRTSKSSERGCCTAAVRYTPKINKMDAIVRESRQSYCRTTRVGFAQAVIGNTLIAVRGGHEYVDG